ncbi:MAG: hypothetical protein HZA91_00085 [Verrucomicrobia bacterium]|nr:hypothetical protein [Verrucomicrobiota bacterium]
MQRNLVTLLTLLLIAVGVWYASQNRPAGGSAAATPEDAINTMLDASRRGDTRAYLGCFTETMRPQLDASRQQMGDARFREYLMESQAPVMGVATMKKGDVRPDLVRYEIEFVLKDKNQRQMVELKRESERWLIDSMGQSVYAKPPIPYGTKVFDDTPPASNAVKRAATLAPATPPAP